MNKNRNYKWKNRNESEKCRRRADTVIRSKYRAEWREYLKQAIAEGRYKPRERADTILRQNHREEWKIEREKHAKAIGYITQTNRAIRGIERQEKLLAERKLQLIKQLVV